VDHVLTRDSVRCILDELLSKQWPVLSLGTAALIFVRRGEHAAPLFSTPNGDFGWGVGIFPSIPPEHRDGTLELMRAYSRRGCDAGGKRYLSGYVDFEDRAAWQAHYGSAWATFRDYKRRFDPEGLLNPGFIRWD
jgi:cytokinin dehydrogenase